MMGEKFDNGKLQYNLLPPECIREIVEILTYGANKYSPDNWQHVSDAENRYYNALMRHLEAWRSGEDMDPESGKLHLAHMATNAIFLLWFDIHKPGIERNEFIEKLMRQSE